MSDQQQRPDTEAQRPLTSTAPAPSAPPPTKGGISFWHVIVSLFGFSPVALIAAIFQAAQGHNPITYLLQGQDWYTIYQFFLGYLPLILASFLIVVVFSHEQIWTYNRTAAVSNLALIALILLGSLRLGALLGSNVITDKDWQSVNNTATYGTVSGAYLAHSCFRIYYDGCWPRQVPVVDPANGTITGWDTVFLDSSVCSFGEKSCYSYPQVSPPPKNALKPLWQIGVIITGTIGIYLQHYGLGLFIFVVLTGVIAGLFALGALEYLRQGSA